MEYSNTNSHKGHCLHNSSIPQFLFNAQFTPEKRHVAPQGLPEQLPRGKPSLSL